MPMTNDNVVKSMTMCEANDNDVKAFDGPPSPSPISHTAFQ